MPEEKPEPYGLEPDEPGAAGEGAAGAEGRPEREEEGKRRPKIESPGLLSDFPEDADFDHDPEMDRVILGPEKPELRREPEEAEVGEPFVRDGFPDAKALGIAGAVLLVAALIAAGVNAPDRSVLRVLLALYNAMLHTGTGVVALFAAAVLSEQRLGAFEVAAARMFAAVTAFSLVFHLNLNLIGENWARWKGEEVVLAALVYVLVVATTFRLWDWRRLLTVVGSHFFLWLIVYVGMQLARSLQGGTS